MGLEIIQYRALADNYNYLLRDGETGQTAIVDPSEAAPAISELDQRGWKLNAIFATHHHPDHTGGNLELKRHYNCAVFGYKGDAPRIPGIDHEVQEWDRVKLGKSEARVFFVPGHTTGHIAYYFADDHALFCGDTLFSMGCGRLFEGTPEQMWHSLSKLAGLPGETRVFCGHEYTQANGEFTQSIDPDNPAVHARMAEVRALRARGEPSVPSTMEVEKQTNPFLRVDDPEIRAHLDMEHADNVAVFARIREMKDRF